MRLVYIDPDEVARMSRGIVCLGTALFLAGGAVPAPALQVTAAPAVQTPAWQVSFWVQALPSLHPEPLALLGLVHIPVAALQAPGSWH